MELLKNDKSRNIVISLSVIALVALIGGAFLSTRNNKQNATLPPSVALNSSPNVSVTPGNSPSKEYNLDQAKQNEKDAKLAIETGKSFEPKMINNDALKGGSPIDDLGVVKPVEIAAPTPQPVEIKVVEPDLVKAPIVPVKEVEVIKTAAVVAQVKPRYSAEDASLIATLVNAHKNKGTAIETDYTGANKGKENGGVSGNSNGTGALEQEGTVLLKAGDTLNAVLETEIKSDEPSPVLARIVGGKYNGSKAVCGLQANGEKVLVQCTRLNMPTLTKSVTVSLVAIDPTSTRTGLATDVDHHYFQKYVVGLGAAFVKGYAEGLSRQNTTTTVNALGGVVVSQGTLSSKDIAKQGIGEMGKTIGDDIKQNTSNLRPTVYVAAGTAIGLMALDDISVK